MHLAVIDAAAACDAGHKGDVIPLDIAAAKAAAISRPISETERLPLMQAVGRVLATDVRASIDLPPFDNSAMDGYAVRRSALTGDGPWTMRVAGRSAAGGPVAQPGTADAAMRIFTGAALPTGFDAVVMQEDCERIGDYVTLRKRLREGQHVRRRGEDVHAGATLLGLGTILAPQRLALLAGQGHAHVEVIRKVRVGLISTGTELRDPGVPLGPGQIYNSNRIMIRAMLAACPWAEVLDYGIVPDNREALHEALGRAGSQSDVLITTGGVSAGEEDHMVAAVDRRGGRLDVLKVAMRPGKPVKIGLIGTTLFAGLPGNPNAALVTFRQIALPAIRAIAGIGNVAPEWSGAIAGFTYEKRIGKTEFIPARIAGHDEAGRAVLDMLGRGSSASLMGMALADGIALLPPDVAIIERGTPLRFERI